MARPRVGIAAPWLDFTPDGHLAIAALTIVRALLGVPLALAGSLNALGAVDQGVGFVVVAGLDARSPWRSQR